MTAEPLRRSPLGSRAGDLAAAGRPDLVLAELPFLAAVNLRVDPASEAGGRVAAALGAALPPTTRTAAAGDGRQLLGLGPDEWLLLGPDGEAPALVELLAGALAGGRGSVLDLSAARAVLTVSGPAARDLLEKGCPIDLHPRAFGPGRCAQTALARALVLLRPVAENDYQLLVGTSFAHYLADWLIDAAAEYS